MLKFYVDYKKWIVHGAVLVADLCLSLPHWLLVSLYYNSTVLTVVHFHSRYWYILVFLPIVCSFFSQPFYHPELSFIISFSPHTIIAPFPSKTFMFSVHNLVMDNSQSAHHPNPVVVIIILSSASRSPSSKFHLPTIISPCSSLKTLLSLHPPTTPPLTHLTSTACLMACCLVLVAGAWYWC